MNKKLWINLYEVYTIKKISALNKEMLGAQYAQCGELQKLQEEVANSTAVSKQILRTQIEELKRQEKVRYYKDLAFKLNEAIAVIERVENVNFKTFLMGLFGESMVFLTKDAISNLEEISDKEYVNALLKRLNTISSLTNSSDYEKTKWYQLSLCMQEIESGEHQKQIFDKNRKIGELNTKKFATNYAGNLGCFTILNYISIPFAVLMTIGAVSMPCDKEGNASAMIVAVIIDIIAALIYWKYRSLKSKAEKEKADKELARDAEVQSVKSEISSIEQERLLLKDSMDMLLLELNADMPGWQSVVDEIVGILPHDNKKEGVKLDSMFKDVAQFVMSKQYCSTSQLQRTFEISYNRSVKIMEQLEAAGIVGPNQGAHGRQVLIKSEDDLNKILSSIEY